MDFTIPYTPTSKVLHCFVLRKVTDVYPRFKATTSKLVFFPLFTISRIVILVIEC